MTLRLRSLVLFLGLLVSCRSFEFQRQQVFLRYQPEADVLDVVLIYEGVGAREQDETIEEETTTTLESIGRGNRHFMIWDWPFDLDLEAFLAKLKREPIQSEDEWARAARLFLEYQSAISMTDTRFLLDEQSEGRLCLLQRLHFDHGATALRLVDSIVNAQLLEQLSKKDVELTGEVRTDGLLLERARRGGSWTRFDGRDLVVSVPATPERAAMQLKELMKCTSSDAVEGLDIPLFLDALSSFSATGEELILRFAPDGDGWIHFTLTNQRGEYLPGVAERLRRDGLASLGVLGAEIQRLKSKP